MSLRYSFHIYIKINFLLKKYFIIKSSIIVQTIVAHNCFLAKQSQFSISLDQHFNQNAFFSSVLSFPAQHLCPHSLRNAVTNNTIAGDYHCHGRYMHAVTLCHVGASFYWHHQNAKHMNRCAQAKSSDTTPLPAVNTSYRPVAAVVTTRWQHTNAVVVAAFSFIKQWTDCWLLGHIHCYALLLHVVVYCRGI